MLKKDIENLRTKAISFLHRIDSIANDLEINLVSIQEGKMIFQDRESGLQVSCDLVQDAPQGTVESVPGKAKVGTPSIKMN